MWLFTYNHTCFGYTQITTLNNKNKFGAPYLIATCCVFVIHKNLQFLRRSFRATSQGELL